MTDPYYQKVGEQSCSKPACQEDQVDNAAFGADDGEPFESAKPLQSWENGV